MRAGVPAQGSKWVHRAPLHLRAKWAPVKYEILPRLLASTKVQAEFPNCHTEGSQEARGQLVYHKETLILTTNGPQSPAHVAPSCGSGHDTAISSPGALKHLKQVSGNSRWFPGAQGF